jgi:hypothetical protein
VGLFVNGLQSNIADKLVDKTFTTFSEALSMATTIEQNIESRKAVAAVPIHSVSGSSATQPPWVLALQEQLQSRSTTQARPNVIPSRRRDQSHPYSRNANTKVNSIVKNNINVDHSHASTGIQCSFCSAGGHQREDCRTLQRINSRRSARGIALLTIEATTSPNSLNTSDIGPRMLVEVLICGIPLTALIDTGAQASFIHSDIVPILPSFTSLGKSVLNFTAGNSGTVAHDDLITCSFFIHNSIDTIPHNFFVSGDIPFDLIVGTDLQSRLGILNDPAHRAIMLKNGTLLQCKNTETSIIDIADLSTVTTDSSSGDMSFDVFLSSFNSLELVDDVLPSSAEPHVDNVELIQTVTINNALSQEVQQALRTLLLVFHSSFLPPSGSSPSLLPPFLHSLWTRVTLNQFMLDPFAFLTLREQSFQRSLPNTCSVVGLSLLLHLGHRRPSLFVEVARKEWWLTSSRLML